MLQDNKATKKYKNTTSLDVTHRICMYPDNVPVNNSENKRTGLDLRSINEAVSVFL